MLDCLVIVVATIATSQPEPPSNQRFLAEYPQAAMKLESGLTRVRGSAKFVKLKTTDKTSQSTPVTFAIDGSRRKFEYAAPDGQGRGSKIRSFVFCEAGSNSFQLRSLGEGKPYSISRIGTSPVDRAAFDNTFGRFIEAHNTIVTSKLTDLILSKNFRILDEKNIQNEHGSYVEVDFEAGSFKGKPNLYRVRFEPRRDWAIVFSQFTLGSLPMVPETLSVEYPEGYDPPFFPKKVSWNAAGNQQRICEFGPIEFVPTPEKDFALEFYGLKDVTRHVQGNSRHYYWWWLLGGIVLLFLSWGLKRITSRR